jgi:uncharacterized protein YbcC (UPF0753/DUF2309 family)
MNEPGIHEVLHQLKHYLPAQAPLKDFVHHNTLHAFQHEEFFTAVYNAQNTFGYNTLLSKNEYQKLYAEGAINDDILNEIITYEHGMENISEWRSLIFNKSESSKPQYTTTPGIRSLWKSVYKIDIENAVQPLLFRLVCSYLDQGIAMVPFPASTGCGLIQAVKQLESESYVSLFKTKHAKRLLNDPQLGIELLLNKIMGSMKHAQTYLFEQQFTHQGWSGMVSAIESSPGSLLNGRKISLYDFITIELLLEYDTLINEAGENFTPFDKLIEQKNIHSLFSNIEESNKTGEINHDFEVLRLWQMAYEWTYYSTVIETLLTKKKKKEQRDNIEKTFEAIFCIDDRECSIRRHIELLDERSVTYGTAGFFGVEFYYRPMGGKFETKLCPAPVNPKHLIIEQGDKRETKHSSDIHVSKHSHHLLSGLIISHMLGVWSVFKLIYQLIFPERLSVAASSFRHVDEMANLTYRHEGKYDETTGLKIGFSADEMADRAERTLRSIGLTHSFAPLVYIIGHGASSINNPHYAAYDCGACSGRPGSVNARVFSKMCNDGEVRAILKQRGIDIPESTIFIAALHDTTTDEMVFYKTELLPEGLFDLHKKNEKVFTDALNRNAYERSRKFGINRDTHDLLKVHERMKKRAVNLYEPRPELNHATNALCIVGSRELTRNVFLDRRSFLNSYDYANDGDGKLLSGILNAVAPVCGGINLEYFFSRTDNYRLGAGTKLPHNVMGLIGVANGTDGDLLPGLPEQMVEMHDPLRLLVVVEQYATVVNRVLNENPATAEWFNNSWINLLCIQPDNLVMVYRNGEFVPYQVKGINSTKISMNDWINYISQTDQNLSPAMIE